MNTLVVFGKDLTEEQIKTCEKKYRTGTDDSVFDITIVVDIAVDGDEKDFANIEDKKVQRKIAGRAVSSAIHMMKTTVKQLAKDLKGLPELRKKAENTEFTLCLCDSPVTDLFAEMLQKRLEKSKNFLWKVNIVDERL